MRWAAPILLLLMACTAKPAPFVEAAAEAEQATSRSTAGPEPGSEAVNSNLLTASDIRIAPSVDTTQAATREAINCLRRYLTRKMDPEAPKDYWYAPDMEDYGGPYAFLARAPSSSTCPPHRRRFAHAPS